MKFSKRTLDKAVATMLNDPSSDTIYELGVIAMKYTLGKYDGKLRQPKKNRGPDYTRFVSAFDIVKEAMHDLHDKGRIEYGEHELEILLADVIKIPDVTHVYVATVTEFESGWSSRFDGHVVAVEKEDHKVLLKSDCGKHLCGDYSCFSTVEDDWRLMPLTEKGKVFINNALLEGKRALWIDSAKPYVKI